MTKNLFKKLKKQKGTGLTNYTFQALTREKHTYDNQRPVSSQVSLLPPDVRLLTVQHRPPQAQTVSRDC